MLVAKYIAALSVAPCGVDVAFVYMLSCVSVIWKLVRASSVSPAPKHTTIELPPMTGLRKEHDRLFAPDPVTAGALWLILGCIKDMTGAVDGLPYPSTYAPSAPCMAGNVLF
jgi:hypothetical protein